MAKRKRRLTKEEIVHVRSWMANAPSGNKPSIRKIARTFGVTRASVIKSLGGWDGIQRNRPQKPSKFAKQLMQNTRPVIEGYTTKEADHG